MAVSSTREKKDPFCKLKKKGERERVEVQARVVLGGDSGEASSRNPFLCEFYCRDWPAALGPRLALSIDSDTIRELPGSASRDRPPQIQPEAQIAIHSSHS